MKDARCSNCNQLYPEGELLPREDNGELVCPECSGLIMDEDLHCDVDEDG